MMRSLVAILALFAVVGASYIERDPSTAEVPEGESSTAYSYDPQAANGPPNWASITPDFAICGSGTRQSPIDVPCTSNVAFTEKPIISTVTAILTVGQTTSNFELNCVEAGSCGSIRFRGVDFNLINIHFHSDSENRVGGTAYPLEAHMVHQADDGALLVVAILFSYGGSGDCLTAAPTDRGANRAFTTVLREAFRGGEQFAFDTGAFLASDAIVAMWNGSLTTPPCSEGVTWLLAGAQQTVARGQVKLYRRITDSEEFGNARPPQELNGRMVALA